MLGLKSIHVYKRAPVVIISTIIAISGCFYIYIYIIIILFIYNDIWNLRNIIMMLTKNCWYTISWKMKIIITLRPEQIYWRMNFRNKCHITALYISKQSIIKISAPLKTLWGYQCKKIAFNAFQKCHRWVQIFQDVHKVLPATCYKGCWLIWIVNEDWKLRCSDFQSWPLSGMA